jgi:phenylalanyl-tRNA synthetase alpha chain
MNKKKGHYHPLSVVMRDILKIFSDLDFEIATGPEVESEYYNFDALNIPPKHPARDLWDTFWLDPKKAGKLLRTHTSPVQIRYMEENKAPLAIIAPGKAFRYEATDATHEVQFHQLEGLMIGEDISLANFKAVIEKFFEKFYGEKKEVRLRPSYFPFVEPGVEVDMKNIGDDKWLEIMGAGMVHPKVLLNAGIDPRKYQGFAFGMGIDRLAMLKYGIDDIRLFYSGDLRLTNQF